MARPRRIIECKVYHRSKPTVRSGNTRKKSEKKSFCPRWADNPALRQALLDEALIDPNGGEDMYGHPKKLWNAIQGVYFFGKSCNTMEPRYNCYPEDFPDGRLYAELEARAERRLQEFTQRLRDQT